MTTVQGYFDGNTIVALDTLNAHVNQKVQITLLNEYIDATPHRQAGVAKDPNFYMSEDFDAPLDDFKEYM